MSSDFAPLPAWVRRRDGSQVPFEPDRICQSLYAAAAKVGTPSAFFVRELTDGILHFLARADLDPIPSTMDIAEQVETIVREMGHPHLAKSYRQMQADADHAVEASPPEIAVSCEGPADRFVQTCLEHYSLAAVFAPDVASAMREGLLRVGVGHRSPASLSSLVVDTPRLAEVPWWLALDEWRGAGGDQWIVESPEWLCGAHAHPAFTPHLCERLLSLPVVADRTIELHLNIAEAPAWSLSRDVRPLFTSGEDDILARERAVFLDSLLERWKALDAPRIPAIAWHLHSESFRDDMQRQQVQSLLRLALNGKPIRFVYDRTPAPVSLAEGMDRRSPGVLLEVGLDLPGFASRPEIAFDSSVLLKKLPSLVRLAVSAAVQKRAYLRGLSEETPLKRGFLIERATCVVRPIGLEEVVRAATRADLASNPLSLDLALQILQTIKSTLTHAGRSINLDLRVDSSDLFSPTDARLPLRQQLEVAGKLHARANGGTATLLVPAEHDLSSDVLFDLLRSARESTAVLRFRLRRAESTLTQGELPI